MCKNHAMFYELGWFYSLKSKRSWFETAYTQEILLCFALYNLSASMVWIQKVMLILLNRNLITSWKTRRWKWTLIIESCIQFWPLRREVIYFLTCITKGKGVSNQLIMRVFVLKNWNKYAKELYITFLF